MELQLQLTSVVTSITIELMFYSDQQNALNWGRKDVTVRVIE